MTSTPYSKATILFLNLPVKTFIGIDLVSFNSSPIFHGITNLPPGYHLLYTGTDASLAIRHGRWLHIQSSVTAQQLYVFRWSHEDESLALLDRNSQAAQAAFRSIPELQKRGLVDYEALEDASSDAQRKSDQTGEDSVSDPLDWAGLTSHISSSLLTRILTSSWTASSIFSAPADTESIPGLSQFEAEEARTSTGHNSVLDVLPINLKQTWPEGAIGRDRTDKARDRSWYLGHLIESLSTDLGKDRRAGASEVLGELQFCFLTVLTLANYSCLEQWKRILTVLFTCVQALGEVEGYFTEVVKVSLLQMKHVDDVDGGLFELRDEFSNAWLRQLLAKFRGNVDEMLSGRGDLSQELKGLEEFMREKYGWEVQKDIVRRGMLELEDGERVEVTMDGADEDEESGEYAPVIVET